MIKMTRQRNWQVLACLLETIVGLLAPVQALLQPHLVTGDNDTWATFDIRLPLVRIPASKTYYVCQQFEIADDEALHITRFEPLIDNIDVVHHMLLFGCDFKMSEQGPHPCSKQDYMCRTWLVKWDISMKELVMPPDAGVRIGKRSFKYILLQTHWNNVNSSENLTDSSGMRIHVTKALRQHDIGNVQIGQNKIDIPPNTSVVGISGTCMSYCTGLMLPSPVHITDVYLHMHGLGIKSSMEIVRDREVAETVAYEDNYDYKSPIWHSMQPRVILYPGDALRINCWYSSAGNHFQNETVNFGQGSMAEMCYAFIRYYPRIIGFDQCVQSGETNLNC